MYFLCVLLEHVVYLPDFLHQQLCLKEYMCHHLTLADTKGMAEKTPECTHKQRNDLCKPAYTGGTKSYTYIYTILPLALHWESIVHATYFSSVYLIGSNE